MELRKIPSVERVLSTDSMRQLQASYSREHLVNIVREVLAEIRTSVQSGNSMPSLEEVTEVVRTRIGRQQQDWPKHVINATGVILHTNLGRAPLSKQAIRAIKATSCGYSNLELDLASGERGSRQAEIVPILCQLIGAEAGLVVNNNAGAVVLGLAALAHGKDVIVSRGEAVEIGGGFRIPDVMRQSSAALVEVGTTNRTYLSDYENAINEKTAVLLKVHTSNFRITGFTHSPTLEELVELGRRHNLVVLHDLGSGCLLETKDYGLAHEPTPQESVAVGADAVFFSGDKLLGGPQAGIIAGKKEAVEKMAKHPLARALRLDKLTLAALKATLVHYLKGDVEQIPIWRMLALPPETLKRRASRWAQALGPRALVAESHSTIGGGSLPGETLPTWVVVIDCSGQPGGVESFSQRLRTGEPAVIGRIEGDRVLLDPRTVLRQEEAQLLNAVKAVLDAPSA
jgi:L-seryl-tRNA(Ser) seleniumtransferase